MSQSMLGAANQFGGGIANAATGHAFQSAHTPYNPVMSIDSSGNLGFGSEQKRAITAANFTVEKVENGFILRCSRWNGDPIKVKICRDMDELKDLFIATMVEYQLEK